MRARTQLLLSLAVAIAALPFCVASCTLSPSSGEHAAVEPTIKDTYKGHFLIGTAGDVPGGFSDDELRLVRENFNVITPENYLKPAAVHPLEDVWAFKRPDALVQWCNDNHIAVHGHTLLWHAQTNAWFFAGGDKQTVIQRMKNHITTLVGHYKGKIRSWDVVNEAIDGSGGPQTENLRDSQWRRIVGPEFLTLAFKFAHEADPDAKLYYNDYNIESGTKHQNSMVLLKRLIADGAPIYGVGIQGHWSTNGLPYDALDKAISDYASLGLKVSISELDVTIAGTSGGQLGPNGGAPGRGGRGRGGPPASGPATTPAAFPMDDQASYFISTSSAGQPGRGGPGGRGAAQPPVNPADTIAPVVTDLTETQTTRIAPISAAAAAKLAEWQKTSQIALITMQPQYSPGQVAYAHEQEELRAEQAKQNALRDDIDNDVEAQLLPILTPAQAQAWEASRLSAQIAAQFGTLTLTDEQKAKIAADVRDAARMLATARTATAVATAKAGFNVKVLGLLDQTQFTEYQAIGQGGAGRGGGGRGAQAPRPATAAGLKAQADAYAHLFVIFEKHKGQMDRITFWGLNDARSWRTGQHPVLFDENNQRKPDYQAIMDVLQPLNPTAIH